MTLSLCIQCAEKKNGIYTPCRCGYTPITSLERAFSTLLSDKVGDGDFETFSQIIVQAGTGDFRDISNITAGIPRSQFAKLLENQARAAIEMSRMLGNLPTTFGTFKFTTSRQILYAKYNIHIIRGYHEFPRSYSYKIATSKYLRESGLRPDAEFSQCCFIADIDEYAYTQGEQVNFPIWQSLFDLARWKTLAKSNPRGLLRFLAKQFPTYYHDYAVECSNINHQLVDIWLEALSAELPSQERALIHDGPLAPPRSDMELFEHLRQQRQIEREKEVQEQKDRYEYICSKIDSQLSELEDQKENLQRILDRLIKMIEDGNLPFTIGQITAVTFSGGKIPDRDMLIDYALDDTDYGPGWVTEDPLDEPSCEAEITWSDEPRRSILTLCLRSDETWWIQYPSDEKSAIFSNSEEYFFAVVEALAREQVNCYPGDEY